MAQPVGLQGAEVVLPVCKGSAANVTATIVMGSSWKGACSSLPIHGDGSAALAAVAKKTTKPSTDIRIKPNIFTDLSVWKNHWTAMVNEKLMWVDRLCQAGQSSGHELSSRFSCGKSW
jgi:hypothetical protein